MVVTEETSVVTEETSVVTEETGSSCPYPQLVTRGDARLCRRFSSLSRCGDHLG
jgi:hypothetical protein